MNRLDFAVFRHRPPHSFRAGAHWQPVKSAAGAPQRTDRNTGRLFRTLRTRKRRGRPRPPRMRTQKQQGVIIYASVHHNNTKELVCAIAAENDIDVVDATKITEKDLSGYDLIGFASGIYFGKMHQSVINFAEVNLPENKDVFLICTYGGKPVFDSIKKIVKEKQGRIVGEFSCKGFDTFGPFKLIGGISKGHPDKNDLDNAKAFFKELE